MPECLLCMKYCGCCYRAGIGKPFAQYYLVNNFGFVGQWSLPKCLRHIPKAALDSMETEKCS